MRGGLNLLKQKTPNITEGGLFKIGIDILSRALDQVPSALVGLTSLFGMGRGDPHRYRRHKGITSFRFEAKTVNCNKINIFEKRHEYQK